MNRFWYVTVPVRLDPIAPAAADAFGDGAWLAGWRGVAAILPVAAFVLGLAAPIAWPGMPHVFSESIVFLALMLALALLSGTAGAMLLIGYACGDVVSDAFIHRPYEAVVAQQIAGDFVTWMLMGVGVVVLPQAARRMASELSAKVKDAYIGEAMQTSLSAIAAALLTYLWCQATIVLIRPAFTWTKNTPTVEAIRPVQNGWPVLVVAAVVAVLVRAVSEFVAKRGASWSHVNALYADRWQNPERRGAWWSKVPQPVRIVIASLAVTLLLAGTYVRWFDAVLVFIAMTALKAFRAYAKLPPAWSKSVSFIPALLRFAIAALLGFAMAWPMMKVFWQIGSLRFVLFGAFATLIFLHALFPAVARKRATAVAS